MIKSILRKLGIWAYFKYFKKNYFPSKSQQEEDKLIPQRLAFYKQFIKEGDLCFDVGANIGNRTEVFLGLGAKVVAIEPQAECAQLLKLRFGNKINLIRMALGEREGDGVIYISETSEISSLSKGWIDSVSKSRFKNKQWNTEKRVMMSTLNKIIELYGLPKFCKIDVEGYEEEVLKGLSKPIAVISFEYTIPERLESVSNCLAQLSKIGEFDCNYTISERTQLEFFDWVSKEELIHEINQISAKTLFGDIYIRFKNK